MAAETILNHTIVNLLLPQMETKGWVEYIKEKVSEYVLSARIISNWQECITIAGVATAVIGIACTFFSGAPLLCGCFALLLGASVTGAYCARKYTAMSNLQHTVEDLEQTQERLEGITNTLQQENDRLHATSQQLSQTNIELQATNENFQERVQEFEAANQALEATNQNFQERVQEFEAANRTFEVNNQNLQERVQEFEVANQALEATNQNLQERVQEFEVANQTLEINNQNLEETAQRFEETNQNLEEHNQQLRQQVTDLTLRVTQLSESAERIRNEMLRFQRENKHLANNVQVFDDSLRILTQEIDSSKTFCTQIEQHLSFHQRELGEQLVDLRQLIVDLRTENRSAERINQWIFLTDEIRRSTEKLYQIQNQYAEERGRFEGIQEGLALLAQEFEVTNQNLRHNVDLVGQEREAIREQTERLQNLLNRFLQTQQLLADQPPQHLVEISA